MSKQFDNNMTGVLFKNDKKDSDSHPDYKGQAEVDGVDCWLSAWINEGPKGKFMKLKFTRKDEKSAPKPKPKDEKYRAGAPAGFDDDDAPF